MISETRQANVKAKIDTASLIAQNIFKQRKHDTLKRAPETFVGLQKTGQRRMRDVVMFIGSDSAYTRMVFRKQPLDKYEENRLREIAVRP